jgi:hypothetical protein
MEGGACKTCGATGHKCNSKKCPQYSRYVKSSKKGFTAQIPATEPAPAPAPEPVPTDDDTQNTETSQPEPEPAPEELSQGASNLQLSQEPVVSSPINVLELTPMPASIDISQLRERVTKYMDTRKEFYAETKRSLFIEEEFSEYWIAKTSNGKEVGKGNVGTDVQTGANEGVDAMCVIMNTSMSNEKSLMQNFKVAGVNLDNLFINKKDDEALSLFLNSYVSKLESIRKKLNLTDLYIVAFVSTKENVFAVCLKINTDRVMNVTSAGFTVGEGLSILTKGMIAGDVGNVKLYKSKKRLELRLNPKVIKHDYAVNLYTLT